MTEIAYFALGCFWGPQESFEKLPGVISTRVGYMGGTSDDPTYHNLKDHTETLEVVFDPDKISYQSLLERFWSEHDPTSQQKTQYKSALFVVTSEQKNIAVKSKKEKEHELGREIVTEIVPGKKFYEAEEYHQQYLKKARSE